MDILSALRQTTSAIKKYFDTRLLNCLTKFEVRGRRVFFDPVPGTPLEVTTMVPFSQEGEGTPAVGNPRKIKTYTQLSLDHVAESVMFPEVYLHLDHPICSGTFDWNKGVLTEDVIVEVFDGNVDVGRIGSVIDSDTDRIPDGRYYLTIALQTQASKVLEDRNKALCNVSKCVINVYDNFKYNTFAINAEGTKLNIKPDSTFISDNPYPFGLTGTEYENKLNMIKSNFIDWLNYYKVQLAYIPAQNPKVTQYETYSFEAGPGTNDIVTLYNCESIVKGYMNPSAQISSLEQRIAALEEKIEGG